MIKIPCDPEIKSRGRVSQLTEVNPPLTGFRPRRLHRMKSVNLDEQHFFSELLRLSLQYIKTTIIEDWKEWGLVVFQTAREPAQPK